MTLLLEGINPRAYMRRDPYFIEWRNLNDCFNPRACMRRDTTGALPTGLSTGFNPRACMTRSARHYIRRPDAALIAAADRIASRIAASLDGRGAEVVELRATQRELA